VQAFVNALESSKITTSVRQTRGLDANAACGQLRNNFQKTPLVTESDNNLESQLPNMDLAVTGWLHTQCQFHGCLCYQHCTYMAYTKQVWTKTMRGLMKQNEYYLNYRLWSDRGVSCYCLSCNVNFLASREMWRNIYVVVGTVFVVCRLGNLESL